MNPQTLAQSIPNNRSYFYGDNPVIYHPDSDGEPMAETDFHIEQINDLKFALELYFAEQPDVYVTGNIVFYND